MKRPLKIHFVHGFLGLPKDFQSLQKLLQEIVSEDVEFQFHNLWEILKNNSKKDLFTTVVEALSGSLSKQQDHWFVGYSLGARCLLHWPSTVPLAGMTLMSAHWGLKSSEEKSQRLENDEYWAKRFLNDSWEAVTSDWNHQAVFAKDFHRPVRLEKDFDRRLLAQALRQGSLGQQQSQWNKVFPFPVQYLYGQNDFKFASLAQELRALRSDLEVTEVAGAGHSLPFEPERLRTALQSFYNRIHN